SAAEAARRAGASKRTLERLFRSETHMTLGRWRQRLRFVQALRLLAGGQAVTAVAAEVGYQSPSAFVSAFRRQLGTTPGRYFRGDRADLEGISAPAARAVLARGRGRRRFHQGPEAIERFVPLPRDVLEEAACVRGPATKAKPMA